MRAQILLETLHRVASNAAENEMDAHALGLSLAHCVAWHPPPQSERRRVRPLSSSLTCSEPFMHVLPVGPTLAIF